MEWNIKSEISLVIALKGVFQMLRLKLMNKGKRFKFLSFVKNINLRRKVVKQETLPS